MVNDDDTLPPLNCPPGQVGCGITPQLHPHAAKGLNALAALPLAFALFHVSAVHADTFGSGAHTFTIDLVAVGNPGNGSDRAQDGIDDTPGDPNDDDYAAPYGGVDYLYRIGTYEVSQNMIDKATASGMSHVIAGRWTGDQPAVEIAWYEAAAFVNWLNSSTGHQEAYNLAWNGLEWRMNLWSSENAWQLGGENRYRHKDGYYFLPSVDEWYKAAYHKNDGVTANYWDYPTSSNSVPDGIDFSGDPNFEAVVFNGFSQGTPNGVTNVGAASPYGTFGQGGNVWEWRETAFDGSNNVPDENRAYGGGAYNFEANILQSNVLDSLEPTWEGINFGFRIASIPEPSAALLALGGLGTFLLKQRRKSTLRSQARESDEGQSEWRSDKAVLVRTAGRNRH